MVFTWIAEKGLDKYRNNVIRERDIVQEFLSIICYFMRMYTRGSALCKVYELLDPDVLKYTFKDSKVVSRYFYVTIKAAGL